jgi:hypothetical protein
MFVDKMLFQKDPRSYAVSLAEEVINPVEMLQACLNHMSFDEVRAMLDANELSPRFINEDEDEAEDEDDFNNVASRHHY